MNSVHYSSNKDEWETPPEIFDPLDAEFDFDVDVCATEQNSKCKFFLGPYPHIDGLSQAYLSGWGHCHRGGWLEHNQFNKALDPEQHKYWERGFDDCANGTIDGPIALGVAYIEPTPPSTNISPESSGS